MGWVLGGGEPVDPLVMSHRSAGRGRLGPWGPCCGRRLDAREDGIWEWGRGSTGPTLSLLWAWRQSGRCTQHRPWCGTPVLPWTCWVARSLCFPICKVAGWLLLKGMLRVPDDGRTGVRVQVLRTVPVTMEISERRTSHRHRVSTKQDFLVSRTHLEP